ncbi:MAG TPA: medium chain dehydrogenase/reductase family protein [Polyangia bacterium]
MRQIWITKAGAPEVLEVKEAADPEAEAGQVRIRVRASGINFADLSARQGMYPDAPKIPCVVGYEVSGTIDQIGAGASGFQLGDRVFGMPRFGGYSDVVALPAGQVFHMPAKMSFEEAAALPVTYLTAHHMMLFTGNLRPGMKILLHSAAGGVGLAAIQLARAQKCEIFGTASASKHDFLRQEGVAHPIDSAGDVTAQVREILGEAGGLDLVLDPVGGKSWNEGYRLLGPAGRLVAFGASSMSTGKTRNLVAALGLLIKMKWYNPIALMNDNKTVSGVNMGHLFERLDLLRPQFEALVAMYERGEIAPHVDRTFRFDEAPAAHHYLHDRKAKGKVLLIP